ncbi:hypothetical protein BST13_31090 [Mycobacterium aquaticum]|uniref:Transglycosylase SLT domain-containing protein n=1 Tax=Mycobacterium aquaticum TaxID=1927124 RepID=A0A1X0AAA3_9MYCO|nr:hypothetical protein BST13_31090 [Mycobacterium aquaticum]
MQDRRLRTGALIAEKLSRLVVASLLIVLITGWNSKPLQPPRTYFATLASGECTRLGDCAVATGLPRPDGDCTASVASTTSEPRPDNNTANHTPGPADVAWGPWQSGEYWENANANFEKVTGDFTGVTTQIFQWAACKWGIDEDTIRAVAVKESKWHQSAQSDLANGCYHSFGVMQIRDSPNEVCPINHSGWGGMPDTMLSTALNADVYAANMRSCYDGDYYDGGPWLYGGKTISQIADEHGWDYAFWGCIGSSTGGWYTADAQAYIDDVKANRADQPWTKAGF